MQAKSQDIKPTTPKPIPPKGRIVYENGKHHKDCQCCMCQRYCQEQRFGRKMVEK